MMNGKGKKLLLHSPNFKRLSMMVTNSFSKGRWRSPALL